AEQEVITVDGTGSLLDLSSVQEILSLDKPGANYWKRFNAFNSGILDLSGTTKVSSPPTNNDEFYVRLQSNGQMLFSALNKVEVPSRHIYSESGSTFNFPSLPDGDGFTININAAVVNIPLASSLQGGSLTLTGSSAQLNTLPVTNIDNKEFFLYGGATFSNVVATKYDITNAEQEVITVDGTGSLLDLSSVQEILS
ncbi:MAG: hypothetical protein KDD53_13225, partial [Bdellovibrionales bacterium]|nr:hypothetical protein [Bdellovibrionales bacterium]